MGIHQIPALGSFFLFWGDVFTLTLSRCLSTQHGFNYYLQISSSVLMYISSPSPSVNLNWWVPSACEFPHNGLCAVCLRLTIEVCHLDTNNHLNLSGNLIGFSCLKRDIFQHWRFLTYFSQCFNDKSSIPSKLLLLVLLSSQFSGHSSVSFRLTCKAAFDRIDSSSWYSLSPFGFQEGYSACLVFLLSLPPQSLHRLVALNFTYIYIVRSARVTPLQCSCLRIL